MPPTLQQGDYNEEWVRALQMTLTEKGFPTADDADFGPLTKEAVRDFQGANGLTVDGICGPQTWAALGVTEGQSEHTFEAETIYGDPTPDQ